MSKNKKNLSVKDLKKNSKILKENFINVNFAELVMQLFGRRLSHAGQSNKFLEMNNEQLFSSDSQ